MLEQYSQRYWHTILCYITAVVARVWQLVFLFARAGATVDSGLKTVWTSAMSV